MAAAEWTRAGEPVRVGLIQGNVDQAEKWDPARSAFIFDNYLAMTRQAIGRGAQARPLARVVDAVQFRGSARSRRRRAGARAGARRRACRFCSAATRSSTACRRSTYNSAFLVREDGSTGGVYRKMHLVPFGEYVPFKRLLFFAAPLVEAVSDFSAGEQPVLLPVGGHLISTAICYEIVYPDLVRQFVVGGSELLTTITNDAWFGATSAPYQHFAQASMRAIEEGPLSGALREHRHQRHRRSVRPRAGREPASIEPAVLVGEARFLRTTTVYARIGDVVAYASVVVTRRDARARAATVMQTTAVGLSLAASA